MNNFLKSKKMTNQELIQKAASLVKTKKTKDGLWADVGSVLISETEHSTCLKQVGSKTN